MATPANPIDPAQMRKEVEALIRHLGGPQDAALIERHPHAVKRGTVLVKIPNVDCLQRAVEKAESKAHAHLKEQREQERNIINASAGFFPTAEAEAAAATSTGRDLAALEASLSLLPPAPGSRRLVNHYSPNTQNASSSSAQQQSQLLLQQQQQQRAHSAPRSGRSAVSPQSKGGVISFKSKARLYLGRDFPCGAVDSPGPIYEQRGFGINTNNGRSFTKAKKDPIAEHAASNNAGPSFTGVNSIGRQFLSHRENPGSVVFPKSMRFGEVKENERTRNRGKNNGPSPGPGSAFADINHLPHHRNGTATQRAPSFGLRHSDSEFISSMHFADYTRRCSPGPIYEVGDKTRGIFPPSKAASFGKGERTPLERRDNTPGPAQYGTDGAPPTTVTQIQPPKIGFSKAVRQHRVVNDSPGPIYTLSYSLLDKGQHAVRIGGGPDEDIEKDRFSAGARVFLGKGLGVDAVGCASPGPMYNPQQKWDGPQVTMTFKEKKVRPSLFPRPQRARFISEGLSKSENLGAHSPGPGANYVLPSVGIRSGKDSGVVCYSFGSSKTDRADTSAVPSDPARKGGKNKSPTSAARGGTEGAGAAMRSANAGGGTEGVNNDSGMHSRVPFYDTNVSVLSTVKPTRSVVISPVTKRKSPGRSGSAGAVAGGSGGAADASSGSLNHNNNNNNNKSSKSRGADNDDSNNDVRTDGHLYNPDVNFRYPSAPKFSFGKGDRSSTIWKTTDDRNNSKLANFGTTININWSQVEHHAHAPRLGGLSRPGL